MNISRRDSVFRTFRRAFKTVWRERPGYLRTRDWLAHFYNGLINRTPFPLPGRGGIWELRLRGFDHPILVRQGTRDWAVLREVLLSGEYSFALEHLRSEEVRQVVDLGANVGYTVRLWQQHFPTANVIAVEPARESLSLCRANAQAGKSEGSVTCLGVSAGATTGTAWLRRAVDPVMHIVASAPLSAVDEPVPVLPVEEILAEGGAREQIDLLKCDIEGAEEQLFANCRDWIRRVRWILVEVHGDYDLNALTTDLELNGGRPEVIARQGKTPSGGERVELALLRMGEPPPGA